MSVRGFPMVITARNSAAAAVADAIAPRQIPEIPPEMRMARAQPEQSPTLPNIATAAAVTFPLPPNLNNVTIAYGPVPPVPGNVAAHETHNESVRIIHYFAGTERGEIRRS